jgi:hypothetical protein
MLSPKATDTRWHLGGLFSIVQVLYAWKQNQHAASVFVQELQDTCQLATLPRSLTEAMLCAELPSFMLLLQTARYLIKVSSIGVKHKIGPADVFEFVELTMVLTYEQVEVVIIAMSSWLIGSDRENLQLLLYVQRILTKWHLRSIRRLNGNLSCDGHQSF